MSFVDDFWGALGSNVKRRVNGRSASTGANSTESVGSVTGNLFYGIISDYTKSKDIKGAIVDRVAQTKTVQDYAAKERATQIRAFLTNPTHWLIAGVVVLVIGYAGFAWGKR